MPGQTRPLALRLHQASHSCECVIFRLIYTKSNESRTQQSHIVHVELHERNKNDTHLFTFLHPSGIISHAILRAPTQNHSSVLFQKRALPITLILHGAGVDVSNQQAQDVLDQCSELNTWTIFPSGVTTWCVVSCLQPSDRLSHYLLHQTSTLLVILPDCALNMVLAARL